MSKREFRPQSEVTGPTYPTSDGFAPRRRHFLLGLAAGLGLALLGGDAAAGESKKPTPKKPPKKQPKKPAPPRDLDGDVAGPNAVLDEETCEAWDAPHLVAGDHDDKKKPKPKGGKKGGDEGKKRLPPVKGDVAQPDAAVDAETQGPWDTERP